MAIYKRSRKTGKISYDVIYYEPGSKQKWRTFDKKGDADAFEGKIKAAKKEDRKEMDMEILMSDKIKKEVLVALKKALKYHPQGVTVPYLHELVFKDKYHSISIYKAMSEMEAAGLLKSSSGRSLRGRPTKLYILNGEKVMYRIQPTEVKFPSYISKAVKEWDTEFPTTARSIRSRHLMIDHCLSILSSECKVAIPEQASVIQAQYLYDYAIKNGCTHSGAMNKVRCLRKLLYYLGVKDDQNPFHLALKSRSRVKNLPVIKRTSTGRKNTIKKSGHLSTHVLEEVLAGIQIMCKEPEYTKGVSPSVLHRELFFKNWDISHTYRACQTLQNHGMLSSTFGKTNNITRKFYLPTGKRFFQISDQEVPCVNSPPLHSDILVIDDPLDQGSPSPVELDKANRLVGQTFLKRETQKTAFPTISNQVAQAVSALNWLADRVIQLEDELNGVRKTLAKITAHAREAMDQHGN